MRNNLILICILFLPFMVQGQVVADFTASPSRGCSPLVVDFTNLSTGAVSYEWDFGNGNKSTLKDPSAIYYVPGTYKVTLTATGATGQKSSYTISNIRVLKKPFANFKFDNTPVCAGSRVFFQSKSQEGDTTIIAYEWDFGDGGTGSGDTLTYEYNNNGNFTVSLFVKDENGCSDDTIFKQAIEILQQPKAKFTVSDLVFCSAPATVKFTNQSTLATPHTYQWDFGDSATSTTTNPTHKYKADGNYNPRLIVTSSDGCKDTFSLQAPIEITPLKADFEFVDHICGPDMISFTNLSMPQTSGMKYSWSVDGTNVNDSADINVLMVPGKHKVKMVASDIGCNDSAEYEVEVYQYPSGKFKVAPKIVCNVPETINLTYNNDTFDSYMWTANGKAISTKPNATHVFKNTSDVTYELIVSDNGCEVKYSQLVQYSNPDFTISRPAKGCVPLPVQFNLQDNSKFKITDIVWDFGDGSGNSTLNSPKHTFQDTGAFKVTAIVTDINGCKDTQQLIVEAGLRIPPRLTVDDSPVCNGDTVIFFNLTNEKPVRPHQYIWILGDSMRESFDLKPIKYVFHQAPGDKPIMILANHFGCLDSFIFENTIPVLAPFSVPILDGPDCAPTDVTFIDRSIGATWRKWLGDPVDGESDTVIVRNVKPGKYKVGLATYNDTTGCRDTSYVVRNFRQNPSVSYSVTGNPNCPPVTFGVEVSVNQTDSLYIFIDDQEYFQEINNSGSVTKSFNGLPSDFEITISARNGESCRVDSVVTINGDGPTAVGRVAVRGSCFPYNLTLNDATFGLDTFDHFWIIDDRVRIPVNSKWMKYDLVEKILGQDTVEVRLEVTGDTCIDNEVFYIPVDNREMLIQTDTIEFCSEVHYDLRLRKGANAKGTTTQKWAVNSTWDSDFSSNRHRMYSLPWAGNTDTFRVAVQFEDGCVSQFSTAIYSPLKQLKADFDVDTSGSPCPPLFVNLIDKSTYTKDPIVLWEWDLGDGTKSIRKNPGKIYLEPGSFDISLKITDSKGCVDSAYHPDLILIAGPKADRSVFPKLGCFPHTVTVKASSEEDVKYKWDLGDGNVLFGDTIVHTYTSPGEFIPLLTVSDSFGCSYTLPPVDTVVVVRYPEAEFKYDGECAESPVTFEFTGTDGGVPIVKYHWFTGGSATGIGGTKSQETYDDVGPHEVSLVVENQGGCTDTVTKSFTLHDAEPKVIGSKSGVCFTDSMDMIDVSDADTTIRKRIWTIADITLDDTSEQVTFGYPRPGVYPVTLTITTDRGCTYTRTIPAGFVVGDTIPLKPAKIKRVSVVDDFTTDIKIDPKPDLLLSSHSIWMVDNNTGNLVNKGTFSKTDSMGVIGGLNTLDEVYCMMVKRETHCPTPAPTDDATLHCTVNVEATGMGTNNYVEWTPYIGWDSVKEYEVFGRMPSEPDFLLLGVVPGSQLDYIDSGFVCRGDKYYRIQAIQHKGFNERSWSDTAHAIPEFGHPLPEPEVWRASVENDKYVLLEWVLPVKPHAPIDSFQVYKADDYNGLSKWVELGPDKRSMTDHKVEVDDISYLYRVKMRDTCGTWSDISTHGKTMVLKVGFDQETLTPTLKWTKYSYWNEDVEKYLVERQVGDSFEVVGETIGPDDTTYMDGSGYDKCAPSFCYRITAVRNQPDNFPDSSFYVISHSNVQCTDVESHLYAPNAFTMNGDGLNDTYQPRGMFLKQYSLKVFSRWGELIYETNDCLGGWDGTYQGVPCPLGTYLVVIDAIGADGVVHTHHGFVHLLE